MTDDNLSLFLNGVVFIVEDEGQWVLKNPWLRTRGSPSSGWSWF
jgi:hypothetical protein